MKHALASASSLAALVIAAPALAQDIPADETRDEVLVTGIRAAFERNAEIKRDASGVVDAITAEDIGKFPDSNVAAALQRVPGVSIQRNGQRGDPTGITVRGFGGDFNETLVDGRRLSTATGGRSVDFSTVGADFIGGLYVMKTPDLTLSASSIGATVNVMQPKPFDDPGFRLAAVGAANMQERAGDPTPVGGMLISNTFADDTLGILVNGFYTKRRTDTNRVFVSGWPGGMLAPCQLTPTCAPDELDNDDKTIPVWFEQQAGAEQAQVTDQRFDGRIALQWQPTDRLLVTIDDNFSRQNVKTGTYGFALWYGLGDFRDVTLDDNGTVVDFRQASTPTDLNGSFEERIQQTNQLGFNLKYDATDNLHFSADYSYSKSQLNPDGKGGFDGGDIGYGGDLGDTMGWQIVGDSSDTLPQMTSYGPNGNGALFLDPSLIGSHVLVRIRDEREDTIHQGRFVGTWEQDNLRVDFGGSYMKDNFKLQSSNTFTNNFWQAYAGYGSPSGRTSGVAPLPSSLYEGTIGTNNFIPGFDGNGALPPELLVYDPRALYAYLEGLGDPWAQQIDGFNYPDGTLADSLDDCAAENPPALCAYHGSLDLALDPGSIQDITEKTWSAFVVAKFDTELGDMPFHVSAGIRHEHSDVSSSGVGRLPIQLLNNPADPTLLTTVFSDTQEITTKSNYSYLLPSLDLKLEVSPGFFLRFDASRTLTRPPINFLTPVLSVGGIPRRDALTATGGNPTLQPFLSDNYDLGGEYYYHGNSYFSVNLFAKHVTNFIVEGTQRQTINDVIHPDTGQPAVYTVSQRVNGPEATIKGVEVAWQHVFGETGFGLNANATLVDTNRPYDPDDISQSGFAVTGLANSANFIGFYDKNGFEARVALNWRDEYLLQFGQNQNTGAFGAEPTFVDSSLQVDLSTSYQLNEQFNIFFEALNVTNDVESRHGRFDNQLLDAFAYGRRFTAGVRFRM